MIPFKLDYSRWIFSKPLIIRPLFDRYIEPIIKSKLIIRPAPGSSGPTPNRSRDHSALRSPSFRPLFDRYIEPMIKSKLIIRAVPGSSGPIPNRSRDHSAEP